MKNKKKFWIIFSVVAILSIIPLVFLLNFWIYRAKNSYENITDGYLSGVSFEESRMSDMMVDEPTSSLSEDDRSVIRTGNMSFSVDDIDSTLETISATGEEYGATITDLNDYGKGKSRVVGLTIKVEESKFQDLFDGLRELDGEYEGSSISESDVTDTVMDLEARLKNYRSVEAQLLTILESAETVEDTLAVYKELNEVRYNIERVDAELKNLSNQTEYSYIYMNISQSSTGAGVSEEEWRPVGIARDAVRALVGFGKFLGSLLIWVLVFSPVIGLIVGLVFYIKRKRK
ncbi:MAG: DUF4349 domain-containing protein [Bacteroidales bacterium]|jgi:hypothetical protein|nr:DUF4349 domain-containing protein [Bacteroidales bacterium]